MADSDLRARLDSARLYLICDVRPGGRTLDAVSAPALEVDIFQLRDKTASEDELRRPPSGHALTEAAGALFIVNDRPDLAVAGADGVHIGQADGAPERAPGLDRARAPARASTHAPDEIAAAAGTGADYIGVGPVHATPTKPGGARSASSSSRTPPATRACRSSRSAAWMPATPARHVRAGARRLAVVRAIAHARDPRGAARALRALLDATTGIDTGQEAAGVGTT